MHGDGGGKAPAIARPLVGAARVSRFWANLGTQGARIGARIEPATVNGQPGAVFRAADGKVVSVVALDIAGGRVKEIRSIVNPDKLRHIGEVADMAALLSAARSRPSG